MYWVYNSRNLLIMQVTDFRDCSTCRYWNSRKRNHAKLSKEVTPQSDNILLEPFRIVSCECCQVQLCLWFYAECKMKGYLRCPSTFFGGIRLFLTVIWSGISRNQLEAIPTLCYFLLCEQVGYLMSPVATEPSSSSWADFTWQQCHSSSFFLC